MSALVAICLGASVGALARWQLSLWLNPVAVSGTTLPLGTLVANLVGGYLVGVGVTVFNALPQLDPLWRLMLVTGLLGALTTFSTFSAEVFAMLQQQRFALAMATALLHLAGSLLLTYLGMRTATLYLVSRGWA